MGNNKTCIWHIRAPITSLFLQFTGRSMRCFSARLWFRFCGLFCDCRKIHRHWLNTSKRQKSYVKLEYYNSVLKSFKHSIWSLNSQTVDFLIYDDKTKNIIHESEHISLSSFFIGLQTQVIHSRGPLGGARECYAAIRCDELIEKPQHKITFVTTTKQNYFTDSIHMLELFSYFITLLKCVCRMNVCIFVLTLQS